MMYLEAVDLGKLKSQAVCFSGEPSLNHDKKIIGQCQQVLVEDLVLTWVTKNFLKTKHLTYLLPNPVQAHGI